MRRILLLVVLLAPVYSWAFCESVFMFTPSCCNAALIETQCWPPSVGVYGRRFEGFVPLAAGGCRHVKLTSGGVYIGGYTHTTQANETEAAVITQTLCCGTSGGQITARCPGADIFTSDTQQMPFPEGMPIQ